MDVPDEAELRDLTITFHDDGDVEGAAEVLLTVRQQAARLRAERAAPDDGGIEPLSLSPTPTNPPTVDPS